MIANPELDALIDKADELLVRCERRLMQVEDRRRDVESMDGAFRSIDLKHSAPSLLAPEEFEEYRTAVTAVLDQLQTAHAAIPELVTSVEAARHLLGRARLGGDDAGHAFVIRVQPDAALAEGDPLEMIRALAALGDLQEATPDLRALPSLEAMDPERCYLTWTITLVSPQGVDELRHALTSISPSGLTLAGRRELHS